MGILAGNGNEDAPLVQLPDYVGNGWSQRHVALEQDAVPQRIIQIEYDTLRRRALGCFCKLIGVVGCLGVPNEVESEADRKSVVEGKGVQYVCISVVAV